MAGIRLGSGESVRAFKGIICDDISEFESHMPSHAVRSLWRGVNGLCGYRRSGNPESVRAWVVPFSVSNREASEMENSFIPHRRTEYPNDVRPSS
jgi:hypothetical protein